MISRKENAKNRFADNQRIAAEMNFTAGFQAGAVFMLAVSTRNSARNDLRQLPEIPECVRAAELLDEMVKNLLDGLPENIREHAAKIAERAA